jgi:hypothetical protein
MLFLNYPVRFEGASDVANQKMTAHRILDPMQFLLGNESDQLIS